MAQHCGGEVVLPRPLVNRTLRQRLRADGTELTQTPGELHVFRYHPRPLFPGQEIVLTSCWVGLHANNTEAVRSGQATIGWRIYADDSSAVVGERRLRDYGVVQEGLRWLSARSRR